MQAKEEVAGRAKNKAVLQNAAAAKKNITDERASMWGDRLGEDQCAIDSDIEEMTTS